MIVLFTKAAKVFAAASVPRAVISLVAGCLAVLLLGLALLLHALWVWKQAGYGMLSYGDNMRRLIPAVTLIVVAIQICFSSFFLSVLGLKTDSRRPPNT